MDPTQSFIHVLQSKGSLTDEEAKSALPSSQDVGDQIRAANVLLKPLQLEIRSFQQRGTTHHALVNLLPDEIAKIHASGYPATQCALFKKMLDSLTDENGSFTKDDMETERDKTLTLRDVEEFIRDLKAGGWIKDAPGEGEYRLGPRGVLEFATKFGIQTLVY